MIVLGYVLHIYCDELKDGEDLHAGAQFHADTKAKALAAARKAGWSINVRAGKSYCPACAKERWERSLNRR